MSAAMLLAGCNAPTYNTPGEFDLPQIITDHELLITRATDVALDDLTKLIRSREDGETAVLEAGLTQDQLDLFDEDHDDVVDIATQRRELALVVLKHVLNEVFPADNGFGSGNPSLNTEVTWMWVTVGDQRQPLLMTGGMSYGDQPTDVMPALIVLDMLDLFKEPFTRPGTEPSAPVRTLDSEELYALNDQLTQRLSEHGWNADTEDDDDALNELTHAVAEHHASINALVDVFVAKHRTIE